MKQLDADTVADFLARRLAVFIKGQLFWVTANTITTRGVGSAGLRALTGSRALAQGLQG